MANSFKRKRRKESGRRMFIGHIFCHGHGSFPDRGNVEITRWKFLSVSSVWTKNMVGLKSLFLNSHGNGRIWVTKIGVTLYFLKSIALMGS